CSEIIFCTSGGCDSSDSCPLTQTETEGEHREVQHIHNHGGREVFLEITTSPITDDNGVIRQVVHVARDITERKRAEQEIQQLAYYDTLTSLPNRTLLKDRLGQALAQASRSSEQIGVMFLDLDRFKGVNDTLGHAVGDQLLKTVSSRLSAALRRSDTVARLGGDEFVIVVSLVPHAEYLADVAAKILAIVAQPARIANHDLFLTGSIGMALFPSDGDTVDTLLKHADIAMYQAKEKGRNTYQFFSHEMNTKALERMALETSLRQALERNEFFLLYQPQYALGNGQIVGVEALLRWQHPELGVVRPGQFIPLAEETGLILPIGEWVLRRATSDGCRWLQQNLPFQRIAVNISPHQCRQQDPGYLGRLLKEVGFPPTSLELELTETSIMENPREIASKLRLFQEMGVALAIDDFGTGYSSLNYLKHFPLDRLKIAQTFVRDSGKSLGDAAIAEAIIGLAHALRLRVIAEGVETMEQLTFLRERGCNEVQGYLTGRPMPAEELEQLLSSGRNEVGQMLTSY
ncbi:MAG TPA: EAL domain-containing protein, partial [Geobacterales bacterium]|nr:EAL domain-containing protein [Geobacterales bacterium]